MVTMKRRGAVRTKVIGVVLILTQEGEKGNSEGLCRRLW